MFALCDVSRRLQYLILIQGTHLGFRYLDWDYCRHESWQIRYSYIQTRKYRCSDRFDTATFNTKVQVLQQTKVSWLVFRGLPLQARYSLCP
jgi:hypothetical protein